jgi:hypothetical protein
MVPVCCAGRAWSGPALQEVAQDMFNTGKLIVENVSSQPMDACSPTPDWHAPLRCYTPAMFNAEVSLVCLILDSSADRAWSNLVEACHSLLLIARTNGLCLAVHHTSTWLCCVFLHSTSQFTWEN